MRSKDTFFFHSHIRNSNIFLKINTCMCSVATALNSSNDYKIEKQDNTHEDI